MYSSREEKYAKLIGALREWGALKGNPTYEEAVRQLENFLSPSYSQQNFQCIFGKFALCAGDWSILTADELESGRKLIRGKQVIPKKPKLWVRVFATTNYYGKDVVAITPPGLVLWEVANVDEADVQMLCARLSELLSMPIAYKSI